MQRTIAMLGALLVAAAAQSRGYDSPFTASESRALSEVWSEIPEAARFEDIDWAATTGTSRRLRR